MTTMVISLLLTVSGSLAARGNEPITTDQEQRTPDASLELAPNPGPEELPPERSWKPAASLILAAAAALAGVGVLCYWLRRPKPKPPLPPHEWALAELARLSNGRFAAQAEMEKYYVSVSWVVRQYLSTRFQLKATRQTTEEFLHELHGSDVLSSDQKDLLARFLSGADLVKFARSFPTEGETQAHLSAARQLVEQTATLGERAAYPSPGRR